MSPKVKKKISRKFWGYLYTMEVINFFKFIEQKYPKYNYDVFSKKPGRAYPIEGEGELIDGKKYGKFIKYRGGGRIESIETFKNDSENGKCVYYDVNGNISWEVNFKGGLKQGEEISYREDGTIIKMLTYKHHSIDGPYKEYYGNGTLRSEGVYGRVNDGIRGVGNVGVQIEYYRNGNPELMINHDTHERIKYYETGVKMFELVKTDGDSNYKLIEYHSNGNLLKVQHLQIREHKSFTDTIRKRVLHGESIYYDNNGNERMRELYKDGYLVP